MKELDILAEMEVGRPAVERKTRESLPTARELSFRIDELEYRVKELEGFFAPPSIVEGGGEVMTAEEYMRREKAVTDLQSQSQNVAPDDEAEASFRWITDRAPARADADEYGRVGNYYGGAPKKWLRESFNGSWVKSCVPWAPMSQIIHFTVENPAPSPYDQEVSG